MIAEVPFPPEQTECPCNPDEFLALSTMTANVKDDPNETRQILQTTRDERDEPRLEVEKLRSIPDPETATGAGAAEDTDRGNFHQEAEDHDIANHEQEPRNLQPPTAEEASSASNGDLLNAVKAFAAEYRTNTRDFLQETEDLKLSNKKQAQAHRRSGARLTGTAAARSNGHETIDLSEENADRTKQHNKMRRTE